MFMHSFSNMDYETIAVDHGKSTSCFTAGDVEGNAMDIASAVTQKERHRIGDLSEFTGAAQRCSIGFGVTLPKLVNGDASGIGQCGFIGQRA